MKHSYLVARAERWLRNSFHCRVVLTELVAYTVTGEIPDAIGWVNGRSILVECKTSRSDFFADKKKTARNPCLNGLGHWRFYLAPQDLIRPDELPEGWGLYEIHGRQIRHAGGDKYVNAKIPPFKSCRESEVAMLVSALARIPTPSNTVSGG